MPTAKHKAQAAFNQRNENAGNRKRTIGGPASLVRDIVGQGGGQVEEGGSALGFLR